MISQDINHSWGNALIMGDGIQTENVLPTTATSYKRGDLLKIDPATNVATHSADGSDWHVICAEDVTAAQATAHAATGMEIPVYTQGEFNAFECGISGTKLNKVQRLAARARANIATSIELRMPHGIADV